MNITEAMAWMIMGSIATTNAEGYYKGLKHCNLDSNTLYRAEVDLVKIVNEKHPEIVKQFDWLDSVKELG